MGLLTHKNICRCINEGAARFGMGGGTINRASGIEMGALLNDGGCERMCCSVERNPRLCEAISCVGFHRPNGAPSHKRSSIISQCAELSIGCKATPITPSKARRQKAGGNPRPGLFVDATTAAPHGWNGISLPFLLRTPRPGFTGAKVGVGWRGDSFFCCWPETPAPPPSLGKVLSATPPPTNERLAGMLFAVHRGSMSLNSPPPMIR